MKKVLGYLKPYIPLVILAVAFLVGQVYTELSLPNLMSEIVDKGILLQGITPEERNGFIRSIGLEMLGISLLSIVCAVGSGFFAIRISAGVARKLRRDLFAKVNAFSNAEISKFSTASLITRTTNDVTQVQNFINMGLMMMLFAPFMGLGSVYMALKLCRALSWTVLTAVLIIIVVLGVLLAVAVPKFKALQKLTDKLNLVSREGLSGMMVIRAFGNEEHEAERFRAANEDLTFTTRFVMRALALMGPVMAMIMSGLQLAVVWFGAKLIDLGSLQIGEMMAFLQYAQHILISFLFVSAIFIMVPRAQVSAQRVAEVLNTEISIKDKEDAEEFKDVKGVVEFDHVSFRYPDAEEDTVSDVSFTARPGETTAFIGSTGSGKSTLINLIPRFYDVTAGSIKIDGHDIRDVKLHDLREAIGYVPQKAVLFSGTIESNVRYGNDNEDITKAIEVAQAAEFVYEKEEGIEAPISQGATNVSGGQKQRLSIARALAKKPPIYVFDDSFSALDFKTDAALRRALKEYTGEATVLIVAQRVSTIMNAQQIIVLDEGKPVGMGTHKELLITCPYYRAICESQLSKEELA
ncbi:MAG: ABC transporter ATP-binding protein [Clostridia bacterium]|nr:ABC transporter ATP-binding protein [Clostridia bacterium]MBR6512205.1 ABC transporter ATP-binding protein [Clostridia bacterium]